jgi:type II secretory pathway predicted ATPase ExeA
MYEAMFGLAARPFVATCRVDRYFPAAAIEAARQTLMRCIARSEGIGLVIGASGTGKTLLARLLADEFRDSVTVLNLAGSSVTSPRALYQSILYGLGHPYRGMDDGELRISLEEHLANRAGRAGGLLFIIDDAHALPARVWEELRQLTDGALDGRTVVRLVALGAPRLEERFASPKMESLNQRVAVRAFLARFSQQETIEFVRAQIAAASGKVDRIFAQEALEAVHRVTDGVPRLVIQVCDHSLILALASQRWPVDAAAIAEAWADLEALPPPRLESNATAGSHDGVVEFGALGDAADETGAILFPASAEDSRRASASTDPSADLPREAASPSRRAAPVPGCEDEMLRWYSHPHDREESVGEIWAPQRKSPAEFEPAAQATEVELQFDESDPFAEAFQHEEVLQDRYSELEGKSDATSLPPAALDDPVDAQWEWACSVQEIRPGEPTARRVAHLPAAGSPWAGGQEELQVPHLSVLRESFDPTASVAAVVSEDSPFVPLPAAPPASERSAPAAVKENKPAARGRRPEYRQLFSRLRRGPA